MVRKVEPNCVYEIEQLAEILGQTPRWLKSQLLFTGQIKFTKAGRSYWVHGGEIVKYVEDNSACHQRE